MKKNISIISFILFLVLSVGFIFLYKSGVITFYNSNDLTELNETSNTKPKTQNEINQQDVRKKIEKLRNRFALKSLISSGDAYIGNQDYLLALRKYLEVYKGNPDDEQIIKKIGDTYFFMKKYDFSYKYYKRIKDYNSLDKDRAIQSLLYHKEISRKNFDYIISEIDSFNLGEQKQFYYKTVLNCTYDFHSCKVAFGDYIYSDDKEKELIEQLQGVKNSIDNYRNFKVPDVYYKDALLIGHFFQNELYPISILLGKNLLQQKPNYKPVLQIVGKSYFELGEYELSKKFLSKYYELQQDDLHTIYLLGIINLKLKDYIISNILLRKVLKAGYDKDLNVRRSLVFNYFQLGDIEKMLSEFDNMLKNEYEDLTVNDFRLAIYHMVLSDRLEKAKQFSNLALQKYTQEPYFYAYLGQIYIEQTDLIEAEKILDKGLELNPRFPMLLFYKGILEIKKGFSSKSFIYFKKTLAEDEFGEFGKLARKELEKLKK